MQQLKRIQTEFCSARWIYTTHSTLVKNAGPNHTSDFIFPCILFVCLFVYLFIYLFTCCLLQDCLSCSDCI